VSETQGQVFTEGKKKTCSDCGNEFFLSASELNFFAKKNLSEPKRCRPCRDIKRASRNADASEKFEGEGRDNGRGDRGRRRGRD